MNNMSIFDYMYPKYKITKPIRLIELFSGYGSQALALKYLGVNFEHWKTCEWAVKSIQAYKDIHFTDDNNDYSKEWKDEHLISWLFEKGISSNYNEPMKKEQIIKLGEEKRRNIFNNIYATHNLVNIQQVKGKDLDIKDTDKYEYIMTYSFPCQDLSLAGKGKGMADTSTRSGMLWEVERILNELKELNQLPQVLLIGLCQTVDTGYHNSIRLLDKCRIRKLTPLECFRLMGVKDEDYYKIAKNQSNASLYHLAGDSLVTLVFCAIMSTMIDNCKSFEQVLEEFYLQISN